MITDNYNRDQAHDPFTSVKVFEHPVSGGNLDGGRDPVPVKLPDGWELLHVGSVDKIVTIPEQPTRNEKIQIPFYVLGKRRNDEIDGLRSSDFQLRNKVLGLQNLAVEKDGEIDRLRAAVNHAYSMGYEGKD